ncbi:MAG: cysteine hydrolase [Shinella sp.]|nr:cysteine hydrolase [Shinella sp.]
MTGTGLSANALHIAIDMQRIFAENTPWHTPAFATILPNVVRLCAARPGRTVFARFVVPRSAAEASGCWKAYYRRWTAMTGDALDPAMLDLVEPLGKFATVGSIVDKSTYSIFAVPGFAERLMAEEVDTVIMSGVETDVCVYSSVLAAVDLGYRVVLAADALGSADGEAHAAVLTHLVPRLPEQIQVMTTAAILDQRKA